MRRVVITGMGVLSPLGRGLKTNWDKLMTMKHSAFRRIDNFDATEFSSKIAGYIPTGTNEGEYDSENMFSVKEKRHMDSFIQYGITAAIDAIEDSGYVADTEEKKNRAGVLMGSGIAGINSISETVTDLNAGGPRKVSPFFIPACLANMLSGHISMRYGFQGPNTCVVTACATGTHSIIDAARLIRDDEADVMVAGGSESAIGPLAVAGFGQARALSTGFTENPEKASRPWDKGRDGFVIAEGAGAVVLEEYEHAKARGAHIYGELIGWAETADAYHITAPGNEGGYRAMKQALNRAGLKPEDIDYINAHGTSTPTGDKVELEAVKKLFADCLDKVSMSSTKSATGHLLGAAGAVEAIYSLLAIQNQTMPATFNLDDPMDEAEGVDLVPNTPRQKDLNIVMSNSFGFGGTNATIILKKI